LGRRLRKWAIGGHRPSDLASRTSSSRVRL
jgi:hypothetical protein